MVSNHDWKYFGGVFVVIYKIENIQLYTTYSLLLLFILCYPLVFKVWNGPILIFLTIMWVLKMLIYPEALNSFMCEFSVVDITRYSTLIGISLLTTHNSLILIYKVVKIWNVLLLNINICILPNNIAFNQSLKKIPWCSVTWILNLMPLR